MIRDIIGIFDLETTTTFTRRKFLNYAQKKNGAVVSLSDELPLCYVLADGGGLLDAVYLELSSGAMRPQSAKALRWSEIAGKRAEDPQKKRDGKP